MWVTNVLVLLGRIAKVVWSGSGLPPCVIDA